MAGAATTNGVIWLDGQLVPAQSATLHVLSHSLHYSGSVFEGERVYGGNIFKLREHTQRLIDSARALDYELPFTLDQLMEASNAVVAAMHIRDGYVRPVAWRGNETLGVASGNNRIHVAIACWDWPSYYDASVKENGIKLTLGKWRRPAPDTAPVHAKSASLYAICTMNRDAAGKAGCQDALMLDYRGHVAEATAANIFLVKNGQLVTPVPDCFLDGITRQTVIALARRDGLQVEERTVLMPELLAADEVFLTGSAVEVTAVGQIDAQKYKVGPVTRQLQAAYTKEVLNPTGI